MFSGLGAVNPRGIDVPRFKQMFLLSIAEGKSRPDHWAGSAWSMLAGLNQKVVKDGNVPESAEENFAALRRIAHDVATGRLPILKGLGL